MLTLSIKGGYPDLNRELTVPHTVVLPFELYPPNFIIINNKNLITKLLNYVEVIRTLNNKHQKFMTCRLVYNIPNTIENYRFTIDNKTTFINTKL